MPSFFLQALSPPSNAQLELVLFVSGAGAEQSTAPSGIALVNMWMPWPVLVHRGEENNSGGCGQKS